MSELWFPLCFTRVRTFAPVADHVKDVLGSDDDAPDERVRLQPELSDYDLTNHSVLCVCLAVLVSNSAVQIGDTAG